LKLDDTIHDLLTDEEYDADVTTCEEYIDTAKRTIQKACHGLEKFKAAARTTGQRGRRFRLPTTKMERIRHH